MPASRRVLTLAGAAAGIQATAVLMATRAFAAPTPTPSPSPSKSSDCSLIAPPARDYCEQGGGTGGSGGSAPGLTSTLDPMSSLANSCAKAAAWTIDKLSEAVKETANVDFTNQKFLQQYAVVFAASTILTLLLWLLAVAKRAVRGVPLTTAISEAIGFLWLTVLASAFTPLILYTVVSATDGVSEVLAKATGDQTDTFFGTFSGALEKGNDIGGGPIMLIVVSLVSILAAGVLWLELVIRAALLYVGALLGTVVYAGLVDKNLWGHVRRWAGIMIAVILVKPVIVIVLGLAGALSSDDGPDAFSAVVSGLAIILLASLRQRDDLPLRPRLRRRDRRLPQQPHHAERRGEGGGRHQLARDPRRPGHQDPQLPGRQQRSGLRRLGRPPEQPGVRRSRRPQLAHPERRRRICPLRRSRSPRGQLGEHPARRQPQRKQQQHRR
ncbi:hypothetical protein RKD34_003829 [Streptomyces sp. SAI-218]